MKYEKNLPHSFPLKTAQGLPQLLPCAALFYGFPLALLHINKKVYQAKGTLFYVSNFFNVFALWTNSKNLRQI